MDIRAELTYTRKAQIGVGMGMNSEVYLADDPQLGGEIVVKEIDKSKFVNPDYFREAQAMFAANHSNVVPIYYACEAPATARICLAMPYYPNGALATRIANGPLSLSAIIRVGQQILSGLASIHLKGLIHFDIKPSNVLFSSQDTAMIADFGQSRQIGLGGIATVPDMYNFGLPPEFFLHGHGTVESDIYQVGLTLYRAVNGDPMFAAQKPATIPELCDKTVNGLFPDRNAFLPHVPRALKAVIRKTLQVDPSRRYSSATAMSDALSRITLGLDWQATPLSSGGMKWLAVRPGQRDLAVVQRASGSRFDVEMYTESNGRTRAKDKTSWGQQLTPNQARNHLARLFRALG